MRCLTLRLTSRILAARQPPAAAALHAEAQLTFILVKLQLCLRVDLGLKYSANDYGIELATGFRLIYYSNAPLLVFVGQHTIPRRLADRRTIRLCRSGELC